MGPTSGWCWQVISTHLTGTSVMGPDAAGTVTARASGRGRSRFDHGHGGDRRGRVF
jgi:hypothetical protein